jgi:hypothetical protein
MAACREIRLGRRDFLRTITAVEGLTVLTAQGFAAEPPMMREHLLNHR